MKGNLRNIRSPIGKQAESVETEFRPIDKRIHRISQTVTKLLQVARPEEYADAVALPTPGD